MTNQESVMAPNVARRTAPQPTPQLRALLDTMDINQLLDIATERLRKINGATSAALRVGR
jgi:hypothetical protein